MSASASKKKRKELEDQGLDAKTTSAKKSSEKKKKTIRTVVIFALVVVVAIAGIIALLKYLEARRYAPEYDVSKPVATVGEEKVSVPVYNLFYSTVANNFANTWGQYGLIQSGVPFREQSFLSESQTVEDYLIGTTNSTLQEVCNVYAKAKADAKALVSALESDGNKCWYSERNMPPDSLHYWEKIKEAIQFGNVTRIELRDPDGKPITSVSVNVGAAIGSFALLAGAAPLVAISSLIAKYGLNYQFVIIKSDGSEIIL